MCRLTFYFIALALSIFYSNTIKAQQFNSDNYFNGLSPDHIFSLYAPYFGKFQSGKIGLQDHGWNVRFRNIKIKEL